MTEPIIIRILRRPDLSIYICRNGMLQSGMLCRFIFFFTLFVASLKKIIKKSLSMQAISAFSFSKSAHPSIKVCRLKLEKDIQPITLN